MTEAPAFVGCVPSWFVTKIAEPVVQLDSPVGGPPSRSPSEVYSAANRALHSGIRILSYSVYHGDPSSSDSFLSLWLCCCPSSQLGVRSAVRSQLCRAPCLRLRAHRSAALWATGQLSFASFSGRFLMNSAVLTALRCSLFFRILSFETICF